MTKEKRVFLNECNKCSEIEIHSSDEQLPVGMDTDICKHLSELHDEISELKRNQCNRFSCDVLNEIYKENKALKQKIEELNKSDIFVKHIENHLEEEGYPSSAKVTCKICRKDIDKIFANTRKTKGAV